MSSVVQDIKNGNIKSLYLFFGEEAYKRRHYKNLLKEAVTGGNLMNYNAYEGKNIDWQEFYDTTQTLPFFADRRLVVVENSGKFQTGAGSAEPTGYLERAIEELPDSVCLAFFEESAAKNRKIYKTIASRGAVVECGTDSEGDVIQWLAKGFAREGKKFRRSTLELLIRRVGMDYDRLRMESEKIISYVGDRDVIGNEDVLAVSCESVESRVFEMTRAMGEKDTARVLDRYHDLLLNREAPLRILGALRSELRVMLQVADLSSRGMSNREIARAVGRPEFVAREMGSRLRYFSEGQIEDMLDQACEFDGKSKVGDISDQTGLELLLIRFSS